MNRWKPDITTVLLLAVLATVSAVWWKIDHITDGLQRVVSYYEAPVTTASSTVTNTTGVSITITTTKNDGETDADFMARHIATVAAAQAS